MRIITKARWRTVPEGSTIEVEKVTKNHYCGLWASAFGSYRVAIPKDKVKVVKK